MPFSAFAWVVDHFEVLLSTDKANIWDSIDITIKAVDKDNNLVSDYDGSILVFSVSDPEASFPNELKWNSYSFSAADEWEIKFENSVIFNNSWLHDISVYDLEDDEVMWVAELEISEEIIEKDIEINILSPEDGLTIWEKTINISWTTKKNHKVLIITNWTNEVITTTNSVWTYEKEIANLNDWENTLQAKILNADDVVIWESETVTINIEASKPRLKSFKYTPSENIETETEIDVELIANLWLTEVNIIVNDTITKLEDSEGKWVYTWKITTPKEAWDYSIDVVMKDELWHEVKELWAESITVKQIELQVASEPVEEEQKDLTITWLKVVTLKTKSVLTWDEIEWVESYSVFQKLEDDTLELIDTSTEPKFEVAITWDEVKYDYFLIKATAKTSSWILYEWDLSKAVKVKTWPEIFILLLISILIWSLIFFTKRKA